MEDPMIIRYILTGITLFICTISDIKCRRVYLSVLIGSALAGVILEIVLRDLDITLIAGGEAVGLIILVLSIASGEKIGMGDAIVVVICGLCLGFWPASSILALSVFAAGIAGLLAMTIFKKPRDYGLPFMPFMLGAFIVYASVSVAMT